MEYIQQFDLSIDLRSFGVMEMVDSWIVTAISEEEEVLLIISEKSTKCGGSNMIAMVMEAQ